MLSVKERKAGQLHSIGSIKNKWLKVALAFSILTIGYNIVEAVVAIWLGEVADSIALVGFGLDSIIECLAGAFAFWRVTLELREFDLETVERAESILHRVVGWSFLALALYIGGKAGLDLWHREVPKESLIGILLAAASAVIMPLLAWGKLIAADKIGSRALRSEAKETIVCAMLSVILLMGLGLNAWLGWWWADPLAALGMLPWLIKEGCEGIRGESCCEDDCH